ncbi:putative RNA-directed DNA polymerase from transposon X-element [Trichonephila clavipes]|nr:putative RNA-directed DNA polymerase from transposon X-element [Trichonephila clavipes]
MSALESLHFSTEHRYPTVIEILLLLRKLERKSFHIIFSWVPGHVGILGNEQADTAARSISDHMQRPLCYQDLKTFTQNYIHRVWQETWDQQILNKLHSIHPSTSHWAALPVRRHDVRLTRLRIGHTRFTHRHLLLDYVGCGVVIEDILHGYRLDTSCSIFTAEAVAIYRALQLIDSTMPRKYCIYTDSMSVLEALENYHDRCHPVVCTILDITSRLYSKGFDIVFCWLPSHVGIIGNEQADSAAKSATTHLPLAVPLLDMKRVIMHHIFKIWQESWSQQLDNKLHSVKPVIGAWPVMPMRRTDVTLTRLRIGHTRFTHRHLLFGEHTPECPSCHVSYTVHHILIDCPVFNHHRITFFNSSHLTLPDLHRSQYSRYSAIYTDGSKRADYVGCGVVIEDIMHGYRLDTSCSIFTAEAIAIYRALQLIDSTMPRKYCIYTDSMSVLEALENYHDRCHPVVCTILDLTSRLYSKGFDIVFCWLPSHVGIMGNEQADSAAKSATTHLPLAVPLSDMKRVIMHHIFKIWQESWSQQLDNKLHSVKPVIGAWPVMPMRRTDVKLTRLRIGHTRFTHRHLLFGERAPECPSCHVSYTVRHILIDCPVFNLHRISFFHTSILTLSDLVGESPHQNLFAFIKKIGFLYLI